MPLDAPHPETPPLAKPASDLSARDLLGIFEHAALARLVDRRLQALYRQGKVRGGVYSQEGNEATSVGSAWALEDGDCLFPVHRGLGARLTRGDDLETVLAQLLGKADGPTAGRDSGLHHDVPERRIFAMISHLGTQPAVACGAALAMRARGEDRVAMAFAGDGSTALGDFHEGVNFAAVLKLPVVIVVENNLYAFSTPNEREFACEDLTARGQGYGMPAETVDGTDVGQVHAAVARAVRRARSGAGPSLVESRALRLRGHSEADPHEYVPPEQLDAGRRTDPVARLEVTLRRDGLLDDAGREAMVGRLEARLDDALTRASARPDADPATVDYGRFSEEGHPVRGRGVPGRPGAAAEGAAAKPEGRAR